MLVKDRIDDIFAVLLIPELAKLIFPNGKCLVSIVDKNEMILAAVKRYDVLIDQPK